MTYRGEVLNGVIVLEKGVTLPDGMQVTVEPVESTRDAVTRPSWVDDLLKLAGTVTGLPADLARNHDHYLYGTPKK